MLLLALCALLAGALFAALQLQRCAEAVTGDARVTVQAAALAAVFIGLAALGELLLQQAGQDLATLQRMLSNLAYYVSLPFLASALLVAIRNDHWSRPAWGRWLIGLFALFELLRRMEQGELYTQLVALVVSSVMLVMALQLRQKLLRGMAIFASLNMAVALLLAGPGSLLPEYANTTLYPLLLAGAVPLTAIAIKQIVLFNTKKA